MPGKCLGRSVLQSRFVAQMGGPTEAQTTHTHPAGNLQGGERWPCWINIATQQQYTLPPPLRLRSVDGGRAPERCCGYIPKYQTKPAQPPESAAEEIKQSLERYPSDDASAVSPKERGVVSCKRCPTFSGPAVVLGAALVDVTCQSLVVRAAVPCQRQRLLDFHSYV